MTTTVVVRAAGEVAIAAAAIRAGTASDPRASGPYRLFTMAAAGGAAAQE